MKLHEHQAKAILYRYGIPVPRGGLAASPEQARAIAQGLGGPVVVKAQVHAGGRGRAGGIARADSPQEAERIAAGLLGSRLATFQTGPEGVPVRGVLVEEAASAQEELYLGIVVDGAAAAPAIIASRAGGVEIEEVAAKSPHLIHRVHVDPVAGYHPYLGRKLAFALGLGPDLTRPITDIIGNLCRAFREQDCSLAEINPLALIPQGRLLALDAKLNIDDSALYRHPELAELRDTSQEDPVEVEAREKDISNYIRLEGNIGCMVNGAGLAMATMDIIKYEGGEPANFLDIGGGAREERVVNAFRILAAEPRVKAILLNIFGGIARVDVIARGVVEAHRQLEIKVPVVVRLAGTNVEEGRRILAESGIPLIQAQDLAEAARKAVEAARG